MECDCSCDIYDHDPNRVESETWHKARKQWVCCECGETIEPGDRYQLYTLLSDSDNWSKFQTCTPCARIRSELCSCWLFGRLRETIWECMGFDYVTGQCIDDDDEAET